MKFYIYKIENIVNKKKYIGITENPEQRQKNHFSKLRNGKHCNKRLQNAWNKYGQDNFIFEVIFEMDCNKEEAYKCEEAFIEKEKGYDNGYNGNRGGLEHNGTTGFFTQNDIFKILAIHEIFPRSGTVIAKQYGRPRRTIGNILNGSNYKRYYEDFKLLSEEEKQCYREDFLEETNFITDYYTRSKDTIKKLSPDQVYILLYQKEFNYPSTLKDILLKFGYTNYSIWDGIKKGTTYQKEVYEYNQMSIEEKERVLCNYMETYN